MTDTLRALPDGRAAILQVLPAAFNWPLFLAALALMAVPVARLVYQFMLCRKSLRTWSTASTRMIPKRGNSMSTIT